MRTSTPRTTGCSDFRTVAQDEARPGSSADRARPRKLGHAGTYNPGPPTYERPAPLRPAHHLGHSSSPGLAVPEEQHIRGIPSSSSSEQRACGVSRLNADGMIWVRSAQSAGSSCDQHVTVRAPPSSPAAGPRSQRVAGSVHIRGRPVTAGGRPGRCARVAAASAWALSQTLAPRAATSVAHRCLTAGSLEAPWPRPDRPS